MKEEETEILKQKYVKTVQTTTSHINNIQDSDNELAEKILNILTSMKKIQISKAKLHSKNDVVIVADMGIALLNADKNNKTN